MPGTYKKRIYMSLVYTDSFRQAPICAHTTQRVKWKRTKDNSLPIFLLLNIERKLNIILK